MKLKAPLDSPPTETVVEGEVVITGVSGLGLSMTPEAALATSLALSRAAGEALRQRDERADGEDEAD